MGMMQHIGFHINKSEYSIPILNVREIIHLPSITRMPGSTSFLEGVANLRGDVIPIVNMKKLFNQGDEGVIGSKVIVLASGRMVFGILVDDITGVINIDPSSVQPPETFLGASEEHVEGVARFNGRLVVILDTRKLIPCEDMSMFEDVVFDVKDLGDSGKVEVIKQVQTIAGEVKVKEIIEAKEFFEKMGIRRSDPGHLIIDDLLAIMDAIGSNNLDKADSAIQNIMKNGRGELFKEVGKVTRNLHESIKSFKESIDPKLTAMTTNNMPDAVDKLQFVIDYTEEAANKTLGIVEENIFKMDELSSHIRKLKEPEDSINYIKKFKNQLEDDLTEILTTQSFQDIAGQTIKKVIKLVGDIEEELLRLITTFGGKIELGREKETAEREKVSQQDVNELLKDFGF